MGNVIMNQLSNLSISLLLLFSVGCASVNNKPTTNQRQTSSVNDKNNPVKVTLKHPYTYFQESSSDADIYSTYLGVLRSVHELSNGNYQVEVYNNNNEVSTIELWGAVSGSSYWQNIQQQIESGNLILKAGEDRDKRTRDQTYDPRLEKITTEVSGLMEALRFSKEYELESKNIRLSYSHDFSFKETKLDDNLNKTYLGTVQKIKVREVGPHYSFSYISLLTEMDIATPKVVRKIWGLFPRKPITKIDYQKINSTCKITMKKERLYSFLDSLLAHDKNGREFKNFSCSNLKSPWEDEVYTNYPNFEKAVEQNKAIKFKEKENNRKLY